MLHPIIPKFDEHDEIPVIAFSAAAGGFWTRCPSGLFKYQGIHSWFWILNQRLKMAYFSLLSNSFSFQLIISFKYLQFVAHGKQVLWSAPPSNRVIRPKMQQQSKVRAFWISFWSPSILLDPIELVAMHHYYFGMLIFTKLRQFCPFRNSAAKQIR